MKKDQWNFEYLLLTMKLSYSETSSYILRQDHIHVAHSFETSPIYGHDLILTCWWYKKRYIHLYGFNVKLNVPCTTCLFQIWIGQIYSGVLTFLTKMSQTLDDADADDEVSF